MYWFNYFKYSFFFVFVGLLLACNQQSSEPLKKGKYFSITNYFEAEAKRLNAKQQKVFKQVFVNHQGEKKTVTIKDWEQELAIFKNNDINKASWKDDFTIKTNQNETLYTSNNPKIPVKLLAIYQKNQKISAIKIITLVKNDLYTSTDTLNYMPDSGYQVVNQQNIKLLSPKHYQVTGTFVN